ncbi:uncharacterized protein BDR25DRAFT_205131, partial [Lindgomyces ingoldianus]
PHPKALLKTAIRSDSIPQLLESLALARSKSPDTFSSFLASTLVATISAGSVPLTTYLLETENAGGSLSQVTAQVVSTAPSIGLLEVLVRHGWDINHQDPKDIMHKGQRLIDRAVQDEELVMWLVEHGARVDFPDVEPDLERLEDWPAPLLETCAALGSLKTFVYLLGKGARLGRRTLHRAAGAGAQVGAEPDSLSASDDGNISPRGGSQDGEDRSRNYKKQRELILRYLVDELRVNINQIDTDVPRGHWFYGSPINYAAKEKKGAAVVRWLLEKGADPTIKS